MFALTVFKVNTVDVGAGAAATIPVSFLTKLIGSQGLYLATDI